jgi:SAM-dependent methyltransferase
MSFWPLPTILIDRLRETTRHGAALELGAGEGRFAARLRTLGLRPVLVDRRWLGTATVPRIQADVTALPVRPGGAGLIALANALRHVDPDQWPALAREAWGALAPRGSIVILEDDPRADDAAEGNYRWALRLLASVDPTRGDALDSSTVRERLSPRWGEPEVMGEAANAEAVERPLAPVAWMGSRMSLPFPRGELRKLESSIHRSGMAYGKFWFHVYRRGPR